MNSIEEIIAAALKLPISEQIKIAEAIMENVRRQKRTQSDG